MLRPRHSALALLAGLWLAACGGSGDAPAPATPSPTGLQTFASPQALESYLKNALAALGGRIGAAPDSATSVAAPTGGGTAGFSATNLQEAGVDEADRFKSDGRHVYILGRETDRDSLRVRRLGDLAPGDARSGSVEVARLDLPADALYARAYLVTGRPEGRPDSLLAIGEVGGYTYPAVGLPVALARDWFAPWSWRAGRAEALWLDVSDPAAPRLGTRVGVDGHYLASRRIGETLYLVTRYTPNPPGVVAYPANEAQRADNLRAIQTASLYALLPKWRLDGVEQGPLVGAASCYQDVASDLAPSPDLIVVSAIDLGHPGAMPRARCLTGASEALYVAPGALYVAASEQPYGILPVNAGAQASYPAEARTRLHKFALGSSEPEYRGSASLHGHLGWDQDKKSFRMGEHQGVLRVATSLGQTWGSNAGSHLSLLAERNGGLTLVSELPNARRPQALGKPGESLYAARFVGARGYLVTFRVVDPLYVLDLADPADPKIVGELAVPGYSDYLQPLGERWLIGVGKDAVPDTTGTLGDDRGAWYQGVKVALFDVAEPNRPREVNSLVIGKRGTQSAALQDHHAFTLLATGNASGELARLALPVERRDILPAGANPDDPRTWHDWRDTGLHLISVTDTGLAARGVLVAEARGAISSPSIAYASDRALLVGESAYYLHGMDLWAGAW